MKKIQNSKIKIKNVTWPLMLSVLLLSAPQARAEETAYAQLPGGETPLTMELQGVNVLDVFKILSKKSGLNIVAGKNVQGQVSIFLKDVPVREALKTILESQGLASVEEKGIIKVMQEREYLEKYGRPYADQRVTQSFHLRHAEAEKLGAKLREIKSQSGKIITQPRTNSLIITEIPQILEEMKVMIQESDRPQETVVFHLRYAQAEDLEPKLSKFLGSNAGTLEIDARANRIMISDIPSRIQKVQSLISELDVPMPQVLIESKIVEVVLSDNYRQGINWQKILEDVGNADSLQAGAPLLVNPPTGASELATLAFGSDNDDLQIVLDLLETVGKTDLLSSPRVTVLNNQEAKLAVATQEPFVSQTVVQTTNSTNTADNVQFVDVGVTLTVQPRISYNDYIEMKVKPEVSSSNNAIELEGVASGSNTTFTRTRIPVVTTQELETTVLVKSGTTLIVGGLIQDKKRRESTKVPILGDIPLVGRAFRSQSHDFEKTELVIFLTPTILNPAESIDEVEEDVEKKYPYRVSHLDPKRYLQPGQKPYWDLPPPKNPVPKRSLEEVGTMLNEMSGSSAPNITYND